MSKTKKSRTSARLRDRQIEALRQEHNELVSLLIHEDSLAWQLNLAFLAINGTLFTASYTVGAFNPRNLTLAPIIFVQLAALVFNSGTFLVFQRSKLYHRSRLGRAIEIEDELKACRILLDTFSVDRKILEEGAVVEKPGRFRRLNWWEGGKELRYGDTSVIFAIGWILYLLWVLAGRPAL